MRQTAILIATVALGGLLAASSPVQANALSYIFTTIDVPGSLPGTTGNFGLGINDAGQIVGDFTDNAGTFGFLDTGGKFTTINPPGATFTNLFGINNRGQILGTSSSIGNFVYAHGIFTPIAPGFPFGINDLGQIVGQVCDSAGCHGYLETGSSVTTFDVPSSPPGTTGASGINDSGQIVGSYGKPPEFQSFLDTRGVFTPIAVPGALSTVAYGINNRGQIVGVSEDSTGSFPAFLDTGGVFTTIDVPGSIFTTPEGINDLGQIVGVSEDSTGFLGAFLATPISPAPEPSGLALVTMGVIGLGFVGRRKPA